MSSGDEHSAWPEMTPEERSRYLAASKQLAEAAAERRALLLDSSATCGEDAALLYEELSDQIVDADDLMQRIVNGAGAGGRPRLAMMTKERLPMRKRILTAQDIQAQPPVTLCFHQSLAPDDVNLPSPGGQAKAESKPRATEVYKLRRTFEAGGLIDDSTAQGKPARARIVNLRGAAKYNSSSA